jgi:DNA-binding MarR family transcriptional regulator
MQTVFLHQTIAQSFGLNATDTRCLDLISSHPEGMVTAGRLSDLTGLTTGAITHILDRLEKRGMIERVRDSQDRRRVFIRVRGESVKPLLPKYQALGKAYMALIEHYSDAELLVIVGYMEKMSEMTERLMTNVVAARSDG